MLEIRKQKIAESLKNAEEIEKRLDKVAKEREETLNKAAKEVRDLFLDKDKFYVMVLPPKEFYVNLCKTCFHLFEVKNEEEINVWKEMKIHEEGN